MPDIINNSDKNKKYVGKKILLDANKTKAVNTNINIQSKPDKKNKGRKRRYSRTYEPTNTPLSNKQISDVMDSNKTKNDVIFDNIDVFIDNENKQNYSKSDTRRGKSKTNKSSSSSTSTKKDGSAQTSYDLTEYEDNDKLSPFINIFQQLDPSFAGKKKDEERLRKKEKRLNKIKEYFNTPEDEIETLEDDVDDIASLITLIEKLIVIEKETKSVPKCTLHYPIAKNVLPVLKEMNSMIGMENIKETMTDLTLFHLQGLDAMNKHMLHTIIDGPPGSGKSTVVKILAKFFSRLGFLESDEVVYLTRSQMVGKYLGHTASQTEEIFKKALGKVLVFDELYSLGNPEGKDSFAKEAIDTITMCLDKYAADIIFIGCGYKDEINQSFMSYNPGLERRFTIRLSTKAPTPEGLNKIYQKLIHEDEWCFSEGFESTDDFFEERKLAFLFNGGDIETLYQKTKVAHARRALRLKPSQKKKINLKDMEKGYQMFLQNDDVKKRLEGANVSMAMLYM